jgi:hypothetical protein
LLCAALERLTTLEIASQTHAFGALGALSDGILDCAAGHAGVDGTLNAIPNSRSGTSSESLLD